MHNISICISICVCIYISTSTASLHHDRLVHRDLHPLHHSHPRSRYEVPATASTPTAVRAAAGGADARFPRGDGATTAVAAPRYAPSRQPTGTAGEAAAAATARPAGRGGARHGAARRPPVNALDEDMIFDMSECSGAEA